MGRKLVDVKINFHGKDITVATSHLESPVGPYKKGGRADFFAPQRKQQLRQVIIPPFI